MRWMGGVRSMVHTRKARGIPCMIQTGKALDMLRMAHNFASLVRAVVVSSSYVFRSMDTCCEPLKIYAVTPAWHAIVSFGMLKHTCRGCQRRNDMCAA